MYGRLPYNPGMSSRKTARVEARVAPETLALLRDAARLEGRSVSDFMVVTASSGAMARLASARGSLLGGEMADRPSDEELEASYAAMAADAEHEAEANEWIEALIGDVDLDD